MRRMLFACLLGLSAAWPCAAQEVPAKPIVYNVDGTVFTSRDEAFAALKVSTDREVAKLTKFEPHVPGRLLALVPSQGMLERAAAALESRAEMASAQALLLDNAARSDIAAVQQVEMFDQVSLEVSDSPRAHPGTGFDYVLSFQVLEDGKHLGWRLRKPSTDHILAAVQTGPAGGTADRLKNFVAGTAKAVRDLNNAIAQRGQQPGGQGGIVTTGTIFFVDGSGLALTNAHVANGCQSLKVALPDGEAEAKLVEADTANDLALIKVPGRKGPFARFRAPPPVRQGEDAVVYGFPMAGALSTQGNLTTGIVSALAGLRDDSRYLQITAPVQHGNSGGPLLDGSGHVMGVVVSRMNTDPGGQLAQNVNFAIKSQIAATFLDTNGVAYETASSKARLPTADIGDLAKGFTAMVKCQK